MTSNPASHPAKLVRLVQNQKDQLVPLGIRGMAPTTVGGEEPHRAEASTIKPDNLVQRPIWDGGNTKQ